MRGGRVPRRMRQGDGTVRTGERVQGARWSSGPRRAPAKEIVSQQGTSALPGSRAGTGRDDAGTRGR